MCEYFSLNMLRELIPYPDELQHLPEVLFDLVGPVTLPMSQCVWCVAHWCLPDTSAPHTS